MSTIEDVIEEIDQEILVLRLKYQTLDQLLAGESIWDLYDNKARAYIYYREELTIKENRKK